MRMGMGFHWDALTLSPKSPLMSKSELHQLCQKRGWDPPDYAVTRGGPDHNPTFAGSVTVNGVKFDALDASKSSKEAQNKAAQVAVGHFAAFSTPPPAAAADPVLPPKSAPRTPQPSKPYLPPNPAPAAADPVLPPKSAPRTPQPSKPYLPPNPAPQIARAENQILYKTQLQEYAQKKRVNLPKYDVVREGYSHNPHFKASVTIDGQTFHSQVFFNTLKQAEADAAMVALSSLSKKLQDEPQVCKEEPSMYKNYLQELAQKEGLLFPKYNTVNVGAGDVPSFSSTVDVGGKSFAGEIAKTKKQAEMTAAKVAWLELKKCEDEEGGATVENESSTVHMAPTQHHSDRPEVSLKNMGIEIIEDTLSEDSSSSSPLDTTDILSACSLGSPTRSLMCNRVRVYPSKPNMVLPEGASLLPFSDDTWAAVSLDF